MRSTFIKAFAFSFLVLGFLSNCSNGDYNLFSMTGVNGEGPNNSQELNIDDFTGIHLAISAEVRIRQGSPQSVSIDAQQNIIDLIETDVNDGIWKIKTSENIRNHKPIQIDITVSELAYAKISGSGNIIGETAFTNADDFATGISGSGDIRLEVQADEISASISGSGDIELSGSADELTIGVSGAGDIDAEDLVAQDVEVRVSGSGDCRVHAASELDVRVSGSGDVKYKGSPRVTSRVSGSGDLEAI